MLNYNHETCALSHLNLTVASIKCITKHVFHAYSLQLIKIFVILELWLYNTI